MKYLKITFAFLFLLPLVSISQSKHEKAKQRSLKNKSVEISQDTVFYIGEAWFLVGDAAGNNMFMSSKEIKTFSGKKIASVTKMANGTYGISSSFLVKFSIIADTASFTKGGGFEGCLQNLFENKVFANKDVDMAAAKKFVEQYKYVAPVYAPVETGTYNNDNSSYNSSHNSTTNSNNSTTTTNNNQPKPQPAQSTNASFTLKNNGSSTVRYFIGTKPKYGSGRTSTIGGNTRSSEHGTVGDQICIVDGSDNPISCMTISNSMGTVYINSKGTGFGDN